MDAPLEVFSPYSVDSNHDYLILWTATIVYLILWTAERVPRASNSDDRRAIQIRRVIAEEGRVACRYCVSPVYLEHPLL